MTEEGELGQEMAPSEGEAEESEDPGESEVAETEDPGDSEVAESEDPVDEAGEENEGGPSEEQTEQADESKPADDVDEKAGETPNEKPKKERSAEEKKSIPSMYVVREVSLDDIENIEPTGDKVSAEIVTMEEKSSNLSEGEKKKKEPSVQEQEEEGDETEKEDEGEEGEEEGEEEETTEEEVDVQEFPREEFIRACIYLYREKLVLKKKNMILQKHVSEYCRKRKLEMYFEVLDTIDPKVEAKYRRQLKTFDEFLKHNKEQRISMKEEIEKLKIEKSEAQESFNRNVEDLLARELDIGTGLISGIHGRPLPEKTRDKLLSKQRKIMFELYDIRLKFIKLRNAVAAEEAKLNKILSFGEGLHLLDYEQMSMENQSYSDKVEERDEELTRLRLNATSSIQTLAHIREKANATALNIDELYEELLTVEGEAMRVREYTTDLKSERTEIRAELARARREAGLLVHRRLIRDFERQIDVSQALAVELENIKNNYSDQNKRLFEVNRHKKLQKSVHEMPSFESYVKPVHTAPAEKPLSSDKPADETSVSMVSEVGSVDGIKKGRPLFFPSGRFSRILTYMSGMNSRKRGRSSSIKSGGQFESQ